MKRASGLEWPITCDSTGGIFASYGMHKVQETTEGVRYNLISHFF